MTRDSVGTVRTGGAALRLGWQSAPVPLIAYTVVSLLLAGAPTCTVWVTKLAIDELSDPAATRSRVVGLVAVLAAVGVVSATLVPCSRYLQAQMKRAIALHAQDHLFEAVERLGGLRRFENPEFQDQLRLAQAASSNASSQVVANLVSIATALLTVTGLLAALAVISPVMAVVVVVAVTPVVLAEISVARRRASVAWTLSPRERRETFYASLLTNVQAAKEVRLFKIGQFLRNRMFQERRTANSAHREVDLRELRAQTLLGVFTATVAGGGLLWAGMQVHAGRLTIGDLSLFLSAVVGIQAALASMAGTIARTHQELLLFGHYRMVTTEGPDLPVAPRPRAVGALRRGLELRDVWFRYAPDQPWVLRGVTMFIPHGQEVALVGRNGSGKSTLIKLLCRLYDPERGTICWDGTDIRQLDLGQLRNRMSAVFQDAMHYDLSAAENVAVADIDHLHDRERIHRAARLAGMHETLSALPAGYETMLTRMFFGPDDADDPKTGVLLSGGQWQRLALARALFRDRRDVMILDEPVSGLDAVAEREVHLAVRRFRAGATNVLVSHRMGSLRDADLIIVLAGGEVVEQGTHDQLMAVGGQYAELFTAQAQGYVGSTASVT
ncbi:ABC transporter ATP-binding protein [Verrucosispora sp. WMMA2121]|uniref:ABC transporter ATP-binding protein n=1 Tax=Verrucosispora sp. WMMA2121 TaxID=3015164 RepID=UPI0022B60F7A|nr:ABC transporter ATP-binding protein [Verrucosispora sp. WMMA2121]MCZ7418849.1 ABC transporter ATP-binding protein [Verrucosispora sp. WMMA2121]